jgi:hypothetical protein
MCCFGCMYSFGYVISFVMRMMFSRDLLNTKMIDNSITLLVLKFYDFWPDGLGAMNFTISLSSFACSLCRSE